MRNPQVVARLLGRPWLLIHDVEILPELPHKDRELFCFLVLFRARQHPREILATLLWSDHPPEQARKHLRQSLWRLHDALNRGGILEPRKVITANQEFVQFSTTRTIWLDVVEFEHAATDGAPSARPRGGHDLVRGSKAADLYRGDLLEGISSEWCLAERERYRQLYLKLVDALLSIYEVRKEFDRGIACAMSLLEVDAARECTYRMLMRLLFLKGDRTSALRVYERCAATILEEFGVTPEEETEQLVSEIRAGRSQAASSRKWGR